MMTTIKNDEPVDVTGVSFSKMFDEIRDRAVSVDNAFVCEKCERTKVVHCWNGGFICGLSFLYFQCKCECGNEWKEVYGYNGRGSALLPSWEEKK
jgi:hypothetical protein